MADDRIGPLRKEFGGRATKTFATEQRRNTCTIVSEKHLQDVLTPSEMISAVKGRTVIVTTSDGRAVSIGRIKVNPVDKASQVSPVSIAFETETMRCELGVPVGKVEALHNSDDGEHLRYTLPSGDTVWIPDVPIRSVLPAEPIVETFPLPPPTTKPTPSNTPAAPASLSPTRKLTIERTRAALDRLLRNMAPPADK